MYQMLRLVCEVNANCVSHRRSEKAKPITYKMLEAAKKILNLCRIKRVK